MKALGMYVFSYSEVSVGGSSDLFVLAAFGYYLYTVSYTVVKKWSSMRCEGAVGRGRSVYLDFFEPALQSDVVYHHTLHTNKHLPSNDAICFTPIQALCGLPYVINAAFFLKAVIFLCMVKSQGVSIK